MSLVSNNIVFTKPHYCIMLAPFKRIKLYPLQKNINGVLLWRKITLKRSEINETRIKRLVRLRAIDLKNIVSEKDRVAFVLHSFGLFPTLGAGKSQLRRLLIPCYRWDCERVRADELKESSFESTPRNDESEQWPPPSSCLRRSRHTPWNRVFPAFFLPSKKSSQQPTSNRYSLHRVTIESRMESFHFHSLSFSFFVPFFAASSVLLITNSDSDSG